MMSITDGVGIFPDGLLFDIHDSDQPPPPRTIAESFEPDEDTLDVFLAIPHYRDKGLNVSMMQKDADTRYLAEVAMLRDENSGTAERPVQIARKNFKLLVGHESQQGSTVLRIARVKRTPANTFQLDSKFVPPLLDISASDYLVSIARRLVEILSAKSSILAGSRRQKNLSLADFAATDTANFWLLYTVNSHFPLFQHIYEVRRGHPEILYSMMLSLAGCLTTFSTQIHPRDLPKYDHDDLYTCFTELDEKLRFLLDTVVPSNFVSLPLKRTELQHIYATAIADDKYFHNTRMYLAVQCDMNEGELIQKVPYLAKVHSLNHIEHIVRHALPGMQLTHQQKVPSAIPMKINHQYFSLNMAGEAWQAIVRSRNLAAYVPENFPEPQLELVILLPEG
jgi:type VI secretion system protein ImpJ